MRRVAGGGRSDRPRGKHNVEAPRGDVGPVTRPPAAPSPAPPRAAGRALAPELPEVQPAAVPRPGRCFPGDKGALAADLCLTGPAAGGSCRGGEGGRSSRGRTGTGTLAVALPSPWGWGAWASESRQRQACDMRQCGITRSERHPPGHPGDRGLPGGAAWGCGAGPCGPACRRGKALSSRQLPRPGSPGHVSVPQVLPLPPRGTCPVRRAVPMVGAQQAPTRRAGQGTCRGRCSCPPFLSWSWEAPGDKDPTAPGLRRALGWGGGGVCHPPCAACRDPSPVAAAGPTTAGLLGPTPGLWSRQVAVATSRAPSTEPPARLAPPLLTLPVPSAPMWG